MLNIQATLTMLKNNNLMLPLIAVVALLTLAGTAWKIQDQLHQNRRLDVARTLETVVETTHQALRSWQADQLATAGIWADSLDVREAAKSLLMAGSDREALLGTHAQKRLRTWFTTIQGWTKYRGYFIIDQDGRNLASSRDANLGEISILASDLEFTRKLWNGETALSLPQKSEVALRDRLGVLKNDVPTMFVGAPIRDEKDKVIALFTFRIDPLRDFTAILQKGRVGVTGETYAFDKSGLLISDSRFDTQLRALGLISDGQMAMLNLEIRNPGVDLAKQGNRVITIADFPLTRMAESVASGYSGIDVHGYRGYRGIRVVGAWIWDQELRMGITSEQDYDEAFLPFYMSRGAIITLTGLSALLLFGVVFTMWVHRARMLGHQQRLDAILNTASDGIITVDRLGRIEMLNPGAEKMFGYNDEEIRGRDFSLLVPGWARRHYNRESREYHFGNQQTYRMGDKVETEGQRKNDELFPLELVVGQVELQKCVRFFTVTMRDITADKASKVKLAEARDEAETASRAKSTFLANMSHHVRTPLHAILGFAQLIEKDPYISTKYLDNLKAIRTNGEHLLILMMDILRVASLEIGQTELKAAVFNLHRLLDDIETDFREQAEMKALQFEVNRNEDVPRLVVADKEKLHTVLSNLVDNAIKFTNKGGVTVRVKILEGKNLPATEENGIWFEVEDTGVGIPTEFIPDLFQNFQQARIGSEFEGGTGLGLSIAHSYVERMGGELNLLSKVGNGTIFTFKIPVQMEQGTDVKYDDSGESPPEQSAVARLNGELLTAIPDELLDLLREAVISADVLQMKQLFQETAQYEPEFAEYAGNLVDRYDYDSLFEILDIS